MNRKQFFLGVLLSLAVLVFVARFVTGGKRIDQKIQKITIDGKALQVETASTDLDKQKGLSGRDSLCPDCGMLFIYNQQGYYPFWMKEMSFDIDIIWISKGEVVDITEAAQKPSPETSSNSEKIYVSRSPVDWVLEVNAGWAKENGIDIGDKVKRE